MSWHSQTKCRFASGRRRHSSHATGTNGSGARHQASVPVPHTTNASSGRPSSSTPFTSDSPGAGIAGKKPRCTRTRSASTPCPATSHDLAESSGTMNPAHLPRIMAHSSGVTRSSQGRSSAGSCRTAGNGFVA